MRLIDADALAKKLGMASKCEDCLNCTQIKYCGLSQELMEVCDAIEEAPTIDPYEVVEKYCEERNLVLITRDLFEHIKSTWPGFIK